MFTPKEIRDTEFERVSKGYKVEDVDGFLVRLADQIERLMIEKNDADQKLVILAEKVEQYRKDEDALRSALISAERMKESIIAEATQQKDIMLRDAQQKAEKIVYDAESKIDREEVTLNALKQQVAAFKSEVLSIYKSHLEILSDLPDNPEDMNFGKIALETQAAASETESSHANVNFEQDFDQNLDQAFEPNFIPFSDPQNTIPVQTEAPISQQDTIMNDAYKARPSAPYGQQQPPVRPSGYPPNIEVAPQNNEYSHSHQFTPVPQTGYAEPVVPPVGRPENDQGYDGYAPRIFGNNDPAASASYQGQQPVNEPPQTNNNDSVFAAFAADEPRGAAQPAEESRFGKLDFGENFSFGRD